MTHGSLWVIQPPTTSPSSSRHDARVLGEALGRVALRPAARVLERLGQVPVVERRDRLDAALAQPLGQPLVEVQPALVDRARARRARSAATRSRSGRTRRPARPSGRGRRASAGSGRRRRRRCRRWRRRRACGEAIPDRLAAAVGQRGALDLVGRGGHAEAEAGRRDARGGRGRRGRRRRCAAHPFTAPAVRPWTSHRWVAKKASMTGIVETTPAAMSCAYSSL